ncbi:MAG: hypothetical protein ACRDN9_08895 [Streptosporangiaceae bacterium]
MDRLLAAGIPIVEHLTNLVGRPASGSRFTAVPLAVPIARLGYAHWFFGNLYEAVVNVPELLATAPGVANGHGTSRAVFRRGSPVPYYLPAAST